MEWLDLNDNCLCGMGGGLVWRWMGFGGCILIEENVDAINDEGIPREIDGCANVGEKNFVIIDSIERKKIFNLLFLHFLMKNIA